MSLARRVLAMGATAAAMMASGCVFHTPADINRSGLGVPPLPAEAWPARRTHDLEAIAAATGDRLYWLSEFDHPEGISDESFYKSAQWWEETYPGETSSDLENRLIKLRHPIHEIARAQAHGMGIIRELQYIESEDSVSDPDAPLELVFISYPADDRTIDELPNFTELERKDRVEYAYNNWELRLLKPLAGQARGLVVCLDAPLGGQSYEEPIVTELRSRGWAVLQTNGPEGHWRNLKEIDTNPQPADWDKLIANLATDINNQMADHAYSIEAALSFLAENRPDIPQETIVGLGFSAGALAMPTVAARLGDKIDAVVLIGGGANILGISQNSTLTNGGLEIQLDPSETSITWKQTMQTYLKFAGLDPYNTAPLLVHTPVLVYHAAFDRIVPAKYGRYLIGRLGLPRRYTVLGGHAILFWRLPSQAKTIADWIDSAVGNPPVPKPQ